MQNGSILAIRGLAYFCTTASHIKSDLKPYYYWAIADSWKLVWSFYVVQERENFVFVGQGTDKNTYKNVIKAKLYKAYGDLIEYSFRSATPNKIGLVLGGRHI